MIIWSGTYLSILIIVKISFSVGISSVSNSILLYSIFYLLILIIFSKIERRDMHIARVQIGSIFISPFNFNPIMLDE